MKIRFYEALHWLKKRCAVKMKLTFQKLFFVFMALQSFSCMMNKKEMAKIKKMAVVSISCDKSLNGNEMSVLQFAGSTLLDSLELDSFAQNIQEKCYAEMFKSAKFSLLESDTLIRNTVYLQIRNPLIKAYKGTAVPQGYTFVDHSIRDNFPKLKSMYKEAQAFAFIEAHYMMQAIVLGDTNSTKLGTARIWATYEVFIYNAKGKKIFYQNIREQSDDSFNWTFAPSFNKDCVVPLRQADGKALKRTVEVLKNKFSAY